MAEASADVARAVIHGAVVFTDIVGFTEFTAVQGDAAAAELLSRQEALVLEALPPDARIVKELGDGLMLWFADPAQALHCCLALIDRFDDYSRETLEPLWVRMGMHWGAQTRRRDDLIGHDVNLAARISAEAGPGELLVSSTTVERLATDPGLRFEELGPVLMKGIPAPVYLFRAMRAAP